MSNYNGLSVVIPTFNESETISPLVQRLLRSGGNRLVEVIVCDGGSADNTVELAEKAGARVVVSPNKGRASQMNYGASVAKGDVLYFVHADVKIHPDFAEDIFDALKNGFHLGCYRYVFDGGPFLLHVNAFCTRFNKIWCRGGDQTLFVPKSIFDELGGYRQDHRIMEDYEFILRAIPIYRFKIIPKNIVVSSRKYEKNGYFKVLRANYLVMKAYFKGVSQDDLVESYRKMLDYR